MLPEADLPERQSLLFVLVLFLQCNIPGYRISGGQRRYSGIVAYRLTEED